MKKYIAAVVLLLSSVTNAHAYVQYMTTSTGAGDTYDLLCYNNSRSDPNDFLNYDVCGRMLAGTTPKFIMYSEFFYLDNDKFSDILGGVNSRLDAVENLEGGLQTWASQINSEIDDLQNSSGFSGDYNDLTNKPSLFSGAYADLTGKPSLFSGAYADLTDKPTLFNGAYGSLTGVPSTFAPSAHTHVIADTTGLQAALDGKAAASHTHTIANVTGLQTALDAKFATPAGTTAQYVRGDGSLATLPTIPTRTFNSPTRSLNTAFQISTTQDALVTYSVDISCTSPLLAGQTSTVFLEYADNSGMSTNLVTVAQAVGATAGVLNITNGGSGLVTGMVPAGKYVRIRPNGACTSTYQRAQEVLF